MKAALCKTLDGPDGISVTEIPDPTPGPGEVLIAVSAAALNFLDTLLARGRYQAKPALPFSPGAEVAGIIEAVGSGVDPSLQSKRVCAYIGWGGAREKVLADARFVVPVPSAVSDEIAAGVTVTYGTAMHALRDRARLQAGETVAVLGASGGAGLAAVEIARLMGARVIAAASSAEKLGICRAHGAAELVNYSETKLREALRDLTAGRGVDIVYDCVGGEHSEAALRAMAWRGRFLVVGFAAGQIPRIALNLVLLKGCDIVGVFWGDAVKRDPASHRAGIAQVLEWVASGKLTPRIHASYPLEQTADALRVLDKREATGKVIVGVGADKRR